MSELPELGTRSFGFFGLRAASQKLTAHSQPLFAFLTSSKGRDSSFDDGACGAVHCSW